MGEVVSFKPTKDEEDNMAELKTIIGGSTPTGSNWLMELEIGTIFLVKDRTTGDWNLKRLCLLDKTPKSVMLGVEREPGPTFVEPARFCQKWMWHETLGVMKDEPTEPSVPSEPLTSEASEVEITPT